MVLTVAQILELDFLDSKFWHCHVLAVWLYLCQLSLSFPLCKMRIKIYLLQNMRIKDVFICVRSITIPKKGNAKDCSNYHIIALISHASKVMFKILQARLQPYMNCELPDVLERQRNQRSNCQHPLDHRKSKRVPEKHLLYWLCQSLWLCESQ